MGFPILIRWHLYIDSAPRNLTHCGIVTPHLGQGWVNEVYSLSPVNSLGAGTCGNDFKSIISKHYRIIAWVLSLKFLLGECCNASQLKRHCWFRQWLGAIRQQTIAWANVDPDLWAMFQCKCLCFIKFFFYSFFFKFIVTCRLCDIYVREDNDSNI